MIRSMTSYASSEGECDGWSLVWELRSVNHRFLDISLRLPDPLRFLEFDIRSRIGAQLRRGRVECTLLWKRAGGSTDRIHLNVGVVEALLRSAADVERAAERPLTAFSAFDVLRWPGVLEEAELDRDRFGHQALAVLDALLKQAVAVREAEGKSLAALMIERLDRVDRYLARVKLRVPDVRCALRQKLVGKLAEVTANPNPERLEQELVYWAQRLDVAEELDRLGAHVAEFRKALQRVEATGKRLDFLLQEMNREANTLASKSSDAETTAVAVEIKVLIEQLREQVQNVE